MSAGLLARSVSLPPARLRFFSSFSSTFTTLQTSNSRTLSTCDSFFQSIYTAGCLRRQKQFN
jgi:hypothetical protein